MPFLAEEHFPIPTKDILSWYFDDASYDQDQPVYIDAADPSRSFSPRQARSYIRKLVAGFKAVGLKKGDCVCIHSFNDVNYPIVVNGIVAFGGVFAGTNPAYQPYELVHHINTSKATLLLVEPELLEHVLTAARETGIPESRILIFDNHGQKVPRGFQSWRTLLDHGEEDWVKFDDPETARTTTAARLFSSGTTGLPKAAVLSHYNLVAQHTLVRDWKPRPWKARRLGVTPFFHAAAVPVVHFTPLRDGSQMYVMRRFDLEEFLKHIQDYQITDAILVPPMVIAIIMSSIAKKYSLKSIRQALCGAAPLDRGPQARLQALLADDASFTQVWGMTETSCICSLVPYPQTDNTGSVGVMLPGMDVKLVDDDGKDITAFDTRGEACVRGPLVISGYFENPEANAKDWDQDGYFHTGDVAYCDGKSKLWYLVDRKKELIKVRGFQVAPPELEAVLLSHPQIIDAAVIGVKFSRDESELPRAYVVKREGVEGDKLAAEDVKNYLGARLANFKRLEGGVVFVDAIPKNASGKILKRLLREQAAREMGAKL